MFNWLNFLKCYCFQGHSCSPESTAVVLLSIKLNVGQTARLLTSINFLSRLTIHEKYILLQRECKCRLYIGACPVDDLRHALAHTHISLTTNHWEFRRIFVKCSFPSPIRKESFMKNMWNQFTSEKGKVQT
jgi:hypothetical protein